MIDPCPDPDQLEAMLLDELSPYQSAPIELHVASCPGCQVILESLTIENNAPSAVELVQDVPDFLRRLVHNPPDLRTITTTDGLNLLTTDDGSKTRRRPRNWPEMPGYEILDELGRGGMGVVYRAREIRLNRIVSLKMLLSTGNAPAELTSRFKTEAETLARVQHVNVVRIHTVGDHDGEPFFEMEYLEGGSLTARLDGTPWNYRAAARLIEEAARGVEAVHRIGVIHRDLKPSNILLDTDGVPKIGDFGLAKDLAGDHSLTQSDVVLGSPSYMSPEQAEGGATRAGPASDIYALGAIYYELLTGRPPFRGASLLDTLQQVKTADPVPPSRLVPGLARDAETIVLKCLDKAPARRYASAEDLADDLQRFLEHRPILARRVGTLGRLARFCRRTPGIAGLGAAVVLLLILVIAVSLSAAIRIAASADSDRRGRYFARMNLTQLSWEAADIPRMRELLGPYATGETDSDLRAFEWYYWSRLARRFDAELIGHTRLLIAIAFSPDRKSLVSIGQDRSVIVWDRATARDRLVFKSPQDLQTVAVSPDGSIIAAGTSGGSILIWGPGDREPWVSPNPVGRGVVALRFLDERTVIAALDPNMTQTWDLASRRLIGESQGSIPEQGPIFDLHSKAHAISNDGRFLAVADYLGNVIVRPVGGETAERSFRIGELVARSLAFSPDGRTLAVGGEDHLITLLDLGGDRPPFVLRNHSASVWSLAFSPDGTTLAAASLDNTATLWDAISGRLLDTFKGHGAPVMAIAYSPDGKSIATGSPDRTVKLWQVQGKASDFPLDGGPVGINAVAYGRDGTMVITGARDGRITFWSTETGRSLGSIEPRSNSNPDGHSSYVRVLALSPDGRVLFSAGWKGPVRLWDAQTRAFLGTLQSEPVDQHDYDSMALSADGSILATGRDTGEIMLWSVRARSVLAILRAGKTAVRSLVFSPDARTLASFLVDEGVALWNVDPAKHRVRLSSDSENVMTLAISPDGKTLLGGDGDGRLIFWDLAGTSPGVSQRAHSNHLTCLAFTPDGKTIFSSGRDDVIRVWDAATHELKSTFKGHTGNVLSLAVESGGRALVTGSLDGTARIWRGESEDIARSRPGE